MCTTHMAFQASLAFAGIIYGVASQKLAFPCYNFLSTHHQLRWLFYLVVEQTGVLLDVSNAKLFSNLEACLVVLAAERSSDVLDARAAGAEDVVGEGEESVTADSDFAELGQPSLALLSRERCRHLLEDALVVGLLKLVLGCEARAKHVDGVALLGALGTALPLDVESALVEAHPPVVGLVTSETGAVNTALLASTKTDDLAIECVADTVRLGELEGDGGHSQVAFCGLGKRSRLLGDNNSVEGVLG
jgi:hypothetical protein